MSELAEITPTGADGGGRNGDGRISFSDLVRAHYRWDVEAFPDTEECERRRLQFLDDLARFEGQAAGRVVDEYWCRKQASGVVLVEKPPRKPRFHRLLRLLRLWHEVPEYRLYRETDWVTGDLRKLANLLHECDVLAIKARWGLEGIHQAVVMPWLMAVESHILGFIENDWRQQRAATTAVNGTGPAIGDGRVSLRKLVRGRLRPEGEAAAHRRADEEAERFYVEAHRELSRIEDYYQNAGEKRARLHFVTSMVIIGFPLLALVGILAGVGLAVFGLLDLDSPGVRRFYACMAAGAVGATVSVLMRMAKQDAFTIDHELGSSGVRRLGALRPLIGAALGVVVSLLVQTTLVPIEEETLSIAFYVVVAFFAGFSERWTKVMLEGAMRTIEPIDDEARAPAPSSPAAGSTAEASGTEAGTAPR